MSYSSEVKMRQVVQAMEEETLVPILPAVTIAKQEESKGGPATISLVGYGIFHDGKLIRFLQEDGAKAFNLLTGRFEYSVAVINAQDIGKMSAQLLNSSVELSTDTKDGKPAFTFRVDLTANITERVSNNANPKAEELRFTEETLHALEEDLTNQLKGEMERVIAQSQSDGVDYLGLADHLYRSDPDEWERVKEDWESLYPQLSIQVEVEPQIQNFYTINQGLGMEE